MISAFTVEKKQCIKINPDKIVGKGTFWVRCVKPDEHEIRAISELSKTEEKEIKEFFETNQRPQFVKDEFKVIYHTPHKTDGEVVTAPVAIFINQNIVVTLEHERTSVLERLDEKMTANKSPFLLQYGPAYFLFIVLDKTNDEFLNHINNIDDTEFILKHKIKKLDPGFIEKMYNYSTTLSLFHKALAANHEVLNSLRKLYFKGVAQKDRENYDSLYQDSKSIMDNANVQREMITNLFNLQTIITQHKLNGFMNKITLIALIIMIPTLISGMYGMNLTHMPFAEDQNGFWIVLAMMALITATITAFFIRESKKN